MEVSLYNPTMSNLISYMEEIGWFDGNVYVVWLHGATDGWPQGIFLEKERAEWFVKNIQLNPEGYSFQKISFTDLASNIVGVGEY